MRRVAVAVALATTSLGSQVVFADQPSARPEAFEVDREGSPPGQLEFAFDGGAPIETWAASVQLGYLDRPFRLHTTELIVFPVERRETVALGGAIALGSSVIADLRLPLSHQVGNRWNHIGDDQPLDPWVRGDLALGARLRLAQRGPSSIFARAALTLPTGDDHQFAGEARYTLAWKLIGRFSLPAGVLLAGSAGVRFRGREVIVADRLLGDELTGAIGATYELPAVRGLWCTANHVRLTAEIEGVLGNNVAGERGPSPVEGRLGIVSQIRPWIAVAAHVGKGLDDQIGAPRFRGLVELVVSGE